MKVIILIISILFCSAAYAQFDSIEYSHGLKHLKKGLKSKRIIKSLGQPDSIANLTKPKGKTRPQYELFYENLGVNFTFYSTYNGKLKTAKLKGLELTKNSKIKVNNHNIANADTSSIFKLFGEPSADNKYYEDLEMYVDYNFDDEKEGILVSVYFFNGYLENMKIYYVEY